MNWIKRTLEWRAVLKAERKNASFVLMLRAILSGPAPKATWKKRIHAGCHKCPIHARQLIRVKGVLTWVGLHSCRCPTPGYEHLGCGCGTTFLALTAAPYHAGCWGRQVMGESLGWPAHEFLSPHQKNRAIWGFIFPFLK